MFVERPNIINQYLQVLAMNEQIRKVEMRVSINPTLENVRMQVPGGFLQGGDLIFKLEIMS
jgi:hypothetical protein